MPSPTSAATGDSSEQSGLNLSALGSPGRRRSLSGSRKSNVEHCCKLLVLGLLHRYFLFLCFQPTQAAGFFRGFGFEKWLPIRKLFCPLFILTVVLWKWHQLLCYLMLSLGQSWVWTLNSCSTQIAKRSAQGSALRCQALQKGAGHPWVGGNHLNQFSTGWSPDELPPASQKQGKRRASLERRPQESSSLPRFYPGQAQRCCSAGAGSCHLQGHHAISYLQPQLHAWPISKVSALAVRARIFQFHYFCCYLLNPLLNGYQSRVPRMLITNEAVQVKTW